MMLKCVIECSNVYVYLKSGVDDFTLFYRAVITISKNWFDLLSYYDFGFEHIVFAVYDRPPNMSCFNHFSAIWGKYSVEGLC